MDCSICGQPGAFAKESWFWNLPTSTENCSDVDGVYHPFCLACKSVKESNVREARNASSALRTTVPFGRTVRFGTSHKTRGIVHRMRLPTYGNDRTYARTL